MLMVAECEFICQAAHRFLSKGRAETQRLVSCTQAQVLQFMQGFWETHQLSLLGQPHLYRLRHAGAATDLAGGKANRATLQQSLRHRSLKSVGKYEKIGWLARFRAQLPEAVVANIAALLKTMLANLGEQR